MRFYYDQPRPAELGVAQAAEMAARLRLARVQSLSDERLLALARKGLRSEDPALARRAADEWLTFRNPGVRGDPPSA